MDITRLAEMAQDFVVSTSHIVGNRTINIMDTQGIIIASSNPNRIGTFHQGAYEAIQTKKTVQIKTTDLQRYPGALEGCNMPIYYKRKLVGVVGIYGEPEDVLDTANLLKVYVTQFFEQNTINLRNRSESEIRKQLLNILISPIEFSKEDRLSLSDSISVNLEMPCKIYIINLTNNMSKLKKIRKLEHLSEGFLLAGLLDLEKDIFGIKDDHLVIIHSKTGIQNDTETYAKKLFDCCLNELETDPELIVGVQCNAINEISVSYAQIILLCSGVSGMYFLDDPFCKEKYLIHYLAIGKGKQFAKEYYRKLLEGLGKSGLADAMLTITAYYDCAGSITKASAQLHIHKNTLLYRLKRIYTLAGLECADEFTQELLLKLVLDYHKYIESP
jgi:carbohydrate diacid regulator